MEVKVDVTTQRFARSAMAFTIQTKERTIINVGQSGVPDVIVKEQHHINVICQNR